MNLAFVVERPTQFEVPLYRHAAADPSHRLRVIYTAPDPAAAPFDPELGRPVDWGFDLLGGYDHAVLPAAGRAQWLAAEMRRGRYDLVIVNGYTRADYLRAARAARRAGSATALRLDSALFDARPSHPLARRLLFLLGLGPLFDLFFGAGTLSLDYLRSVGVPERRTALFPYPIDAASFRRRASLSSVERAAARRRMGIPPEARVVLSVAKLHPREAPWDLLHAFAEAEDQVGESWLVIAGDGPQRASCERFVHERGLERVVFLGYVPYLELPALYGVADLFVHPAREERWGVSVGEALACGLPVVASSRVGAARDLVSEGVNGFTYPAGSAVALADRIARAAALDRTAVAAHNERVLAGWDQAATWRGLIAAAEPLVERRVPLTVIVTTRNEELNLERSLASVAGFADQVLVIDSESEDGTLAIARRYADQVATLPYEHGRIIPWIFQWGLDHLAIRNDWILLLEADQALTPALRGEIAALLARPEIAEDGFYIRRRQVFRGRPLRFGGYGRKVLLKLFRRGAGELDPAEQDTRVYVRGKVGRLRAPLEEWNRKEDAILFYLEKHLRYADAFAREEVERRRGLPWKRRPRLLGTPDERVLWSKSLYYRLPLLVRPALYFFWRYFVLLGILDGRNGFLFHFLQAFWFRLVVDVRLAELLRERAHHQPEAGTLRSGGSG